MDENPYKSPDGGGAPSRPAWRVLLGLASIAVSVPFAVLAVGWAVAAARYILMARPIGHVSGAVLLVFLTGLIAYMFLHVGRHCLR